MLHAMQGQIHDLSPTSVWGAWVLIPVSLEPRSCLLPGQMLEIMVHKLPT